GTAVSASLGFGYGALRRRELALEEDHVYSTFKVGQGSGSAPESERPKRVSASRQPTLNTWTDSEDGMVYIDVPAYPPPAPPIQTPPRVDIKFTSHFSFTFWGMIRDHAVRLEELSPALFKRYDMDIGELFTRSRAVKDEIFSQRYRFRSLEYEQERVAVTFGAIWRPELALESWAENRDLRLQLAEERHARLELAEVVDSMKRGQEPRGAQFCPCVSALRLVAHDRADTHFLLGWGEAIDRGWSRGVLKRVVMINWRPDHTFDYNGLPRMGRAGIVDQVKFTWGF
ncbi:hypothetical protein Tco_1536270, partial [Tanacetum coccineum]